MPDSKIFDSAGIADASRMLNPALYTQTFDPLKFPSIVGDHCEAMASGMRRNVQIV